MELKNKYGETIFSGYFQSLKILLEKAAEEKAYLRGAYLHGADLNGADLNGAYLRGAYLNGIFMDWLSHSLISEILWRASGEDEEKQLFSAWIAKKIDWCWKNWETYQHPLRNWAIKELSKFVQPGDGAPEFIQNFK